MARPLKTGSAYHVSKVDDAVTYLRLALRNAIRAESPRLCISIRRALKSADGARRHAERRASKVQP